MNIDRLREYIREYIKENVKIETLDEITTTGNVAGYEIPAAFVGDKNSRKAHIKKMAKSIGYTITKQGAEEAMTGDTLYETYYDYRNDPEKLPHQKIGTAISEVNKQLKEIEKVIRTNRRLQKEMGVDSDRLWKRTKNQLVKLEGRLMELAGKLREMRG